VSGERVGYTRACARTDAGDGEAVSDAAGGAEGSGGSGAPAPAPPLNVVEVDSSVRPPPMCSKESVERMRLVA
jgi:hypothetical protein